MFSLFKKKEQKQKGGKPLPERVSGTHLDQILPYLGYDTDRGLLVSRNGDISKVFELNLPLIHSKDQSFYQNLVAGLGNYISRMPGSYVIQRLDFIRPEPTNMNADRMPQQDDFTKTLIQHFNLQVPLHSNSYLIITRKTSTGNSVFLNESLKSKPSDFTILQADSFSDKSLDAFNSQVQGLIKEYIDSKVGVRELKADQLNHLILQNYLGLEFTNRYSVSSKDYAENSGLLHIGDNIVKTISLYKDGLPYEIDSHASYSDYNGLPGGLMNDLYFGGYLPKIVSTSIFTHEEGYLKQFLKDNRRGVATFDSDPFNKESSHAINEVVDAFNTLNLVSFHYGISFIGNSFDYKFFKEEIDTVIFSLKARGMDVCENTRQNFAHFMSYLPGASGSIPMIDRSILPAEMALSFPMMDSVNRNVSYNGIPFRERISGNVIYLNIIRAHTSNKTILIFGAPGTGKSFTTNYLIDNFIQEGHHVIISDLGYSYKKLAEYHEGVNMECTKDNPIRLNPFAVLTFRNGSWQFEDEESDEEFLIALFFTCWAGADKSKHMDNVISQTLSKLIRNYMAYLSKSNSKPNYDGFYYHAVNSLENDKEFREINFDKSGFRLVMSQYLKKNEDGRPGRYGYVFDENVSDTDSLLNNRFVIFELEHIKDDKILFTLTYFILSALVIRRLIREKHKRGDKALVFVLDECWLLLSGEYGNTSAFIAYCVRTFRKHRGVLIIITQQVSDIADNKEIGDMVIKSASMKFLKQQEPQTESFIQGRLNMSDFNRDLLYSIDDKYREIYMEFDGVGAVMKIDVAPHQYWLYTSSPDDNLRLKAFRDKAPNIRTAIKNIIEESKTVES